MQANQFLGLVKFFGNEEFLDKLIEGCFYTNTPEQYRLDNQEGIGDPVESCRMSYRLSRNDQEIILKIDDHVITGIENLTIHNPQNRDSWLHCWFELRLPSDETALENLNQTFIRMKSEFGKNFAFIPADQLKNFVEILQKNSEKPLYCGSVKYSESSSEWGNLCKSMKYSYQNEYRFLFGECPPHDTTPYIFNIKDDLKHIILKNPEIKLEDPNGHVWFELSEKSHQGSST
ncbi:hypothetical protein [Acinetobacter pittii]|uniref:hypothetical protein n=1 Tax=Acinetobacter pittii TaxID=48296 RepID=UPI00083B566F|nr:hypothetical protein [Acinetobacter pittii]OCZ69991.1 hypothetical protein A9F99_03460 [Acinetobacter pittii]